MLVCLHAKWVEKVKGNHAMTYNILKRALSQYESIKQLRAKAREERARRIAANFFAACAENAQRTLKPVP
jgi:hypothetical protein